MKSSRLIVALLALCVSGSLFGATSKHISHRIDAAELESLVLEIPVVELIIETHEGNEIELEIDLSSQRRMWGLSRRDVDDIELQIDRNGNDLTLSIDEKNLEQVWKVRLPRNLALAMNIGVGEVRLDQFVNDLDMDLGVGEVRVLIDDTDYRQININVGVGESSIRGFENIASSDRSFVSDSTRYDGNGEHYMDIEIGVGEGRVENR